MVKKLKTAVITTGAFPVPAVRGGGAESLAEEIAAENEIQQKLDLTILNLYDPLAEQACRKYLHTNFVFFHPAAVSLYLDHFNHYIANEILHSSRHLAVKTLFERISYLHQAAVYLNHHDFECVIFLNQMASLWVLKYRDNLQKYKGKYYFHLHNHPERYAHAENLARSCKKIICVSSFIGKDFANRIHDVYTEEKYPVLKNMADDHIFYAERFQMDEINHAKEKMGITDKKIILFVGRLVPGKGVAELLKAFQKMQSKNTILLIVGSFNYNSSDHSPYEDTLNALIHSIGPERVKFTGYVPHDQVPLYYAMADLVILPSVLDDAAPLSVIETIMMHRPLITTTIGGIPEYADSSCAVLLDPNPDTIVDAIAQSADDLLNNPEKRKKMSENAAVKSADWNLKNYYEHFVEILQ